jgi:hypothetical protein
MPTECSAELFDFGRVEGRLVEAAFDAGLDIIREWRSLPKELRQTDEQAAAFAMQIKDKYKFSSENADAYQTVKG